MRDHTSHLSRRVAVSLLVAALAAVLFVTTASPGGASVAAANTKFCSAVAKIGNSIESGSGNSLNQKVAKADAKAFKKAANAAPGKVKSALNQMAAVFASLANAQNLTDAGKAEAALAANSKYRKAVLTFVQYYTKNCVPIASVPTT
jgi:hypothetical protein